jgi:hypothetical protein
MEKDAVEGSASDGEGIGGFDEDVKLDAELVRICMIKGMNGIPEVALKLGLTVSAAFDRAAWLSAQPLAYQLKVFHRLSEIWTQDQG